MEPSNKNHDMANMNVRKNSSPGHLWLSWGPK